MFAAPTKVVVAIPTADDAVPTWTYLSFSPLTKKWSGILIVFALISTTELLLPSKYLSKICLFSCSSMNSLLMSLSVPVYSPIFVVIEAFVNATEDGKVASSSIDSAFLNTLTTVSILAFGVNTNDTVPAVETLAPNVPSPEEVSTFPYSVISTS